MTDEPSEGQVVAIPQVGGLHHPHARRAAWPLSPVRSFPRRARRNPYSNICANHDSSWRSACCRPRLPLILFSSCPCLSPTLPPRTRFLGRTGATSRFSAPSRLPPHRGRRRHTRRAPLQSPSTAHPTPSQGIRQFATLLFELGELATPLGIPLLAPRSRRNLLHRAVQLTTNHHPWLSKLSSLYAPEDASKITPLLSSNYSLAAQSEIYTLLGGQRWIGKPDCLFQSMKESILSKHIRGDPERPVNGYEVSTWQVEIWDSASFRENRERHNTPLFNSL